MKSSLFRLLALVVVACVVGLVSTRASARPATSVDLLRDAYRTLAKADHDYKGHRVAAMKQIEAAARLLGSDFRGEGRGHEKQGVSDEQLRVAQGLLNQAATGLRGKALRHVRAAERQISIALNIR